VVASEPGWREPIEPQARMVAKRLNHLDVAADRRSARRDAPVHRAGVGSSSVTDTTRGIVVIAPRGCLIPSATGSHSCLTRGVD
jgi:hypothetical protein